VIQTFGGLWGAVMSVREFAFALAAAPLLVGCHGRPTPASPPPPPPAPAARPGENAAPSNGGGGAVPAADSPAVTRENFRRIQRGMTQAQVEQVLGPGVRVPRTDIHRAIRSTGPPGRTDSTVLRWRNGRDTLFLELTRSGVAAGWYVTEKEDGTVAYDLLGA
jgi:hypothetical protein